MNTISIRIFAILLTVSFVVPMALLSAPQRVSAAGVGCVGGLLGAGGFVGGLSLVQSAVSVPVSDYSTELSSAGTMGTTFGTCFNELVLMPIARAAIKSVLQKSTSSVLNFINGSNGTGNPSYVQNVPRHLQGVGDSVALPFFTQIATNLDSPFGTAISSSLRTNYLQETSMAGFYASNKSTLPQYSSDPNAYLAGDWSKGGVSEWFALTTQDRNNPYILYQRAQRQVGDRVSQAQTNRRQDLASSGGYLSWCGANSSTATKGVSPSDSCIDADGNAKPTLTPGSMIHDYAKKAVVDSSFDQQYAQLVSANDIDGALSVIAGALISQTLGGARGLLGASSRSPGSVSNQLRNYSDSSISATQNTFQTAQTVLKQVATYTTALDTITVAAQTASSSIASLISTCTTHSRADQVTAAQTVLTAEVAPVFTLVQSARNTASTTEAAARKVEVASAGATAGSSGTLASDAAALVAMPPSVLEVSNTQANANVTNGAIANPVGSLTVSGGTLVDRMNLISTNAKAIETACTQPLSVWGPF